MSTNVKEKRKKKNKHGDKMGSHSLVLGTKPDHIRTLNQIKSFQPIRFC